MSFGSGVEQAALGFLRAYGYLALFILMALETAMILHFVPSEAIVPFATLALATSPGSLVLVIIVSTLGATVGSLMLYAFARGGGRSFLDKHAHIFGLTPKRRARMDAMFQRPAGESTVFLFRLLPFLRAIVSVPAGLARMGVRRFVVYSAFGSLLFNAALAYSTYAAKSNPIVFARLGVAGSYVRTRWPVFLVLAAALASAAYLLYRRREEYRQAPHRAVRHVVHVSAIVALGSGVVLLTSSLLAPTTTYRAVTWIAVDAGVFASDAGISPLVILLAFALGALTIGLALLTIRPALETLTRAMAKEFQEPPGSLPPGERSFWKRHTRRAVQIIKRIMRSRQFLFLTVLVLVSLTIGETAVAWATRNDPGGFLVVAPGENAYMFVAPDMIGSIPREGGRHRDDGGR